LRHHKLDVKSSLDKFAERGHGEARRAAKNEVEGLRHWVIERSGDWAIEGRDNHSNKLLNYQITQSPNYPITNSSTILRL